MTKPPTLPVGTTIDWPRIRTEWADLIGGYEKRWRGRARVRPLLDNSGKLTSWLTATPYLIEINDVWHPGIIRGCDYRADHDNDATIWYVRADNLYDFCYRRVGGQSDRSDELVVPIVWPRQSNILSTSRILSLDSVPAQASPDRQLRKRRIML